MKAQSNTLKEALIKNNVLIKEEAEEFWLKAQAEACSFREWLLEHDKVNEQQMLIALSQYTGLPSIVLSQETIDETIIQKVPIKFASHYQIMPVRLEKQTLTIACCHPLPIHVHDEIRRHLGFDVNVVLTTAKDLTESLKRYYGLASETIDRMVSEDHEDDNELMSSQWIEDLETETDDPTVSDLVNQIILEGYRKRATDIHIEPYREKVRVRYRIDGQLVDANLPADFKKFLRSIVSRIKILANISITEKRLPQDGSAVVKTKDQHIDLRISTLPTPFGESMVIRILPSKVRLFSLEKLGFSPTVMVDIQALIKKPHGIIFITGPTGSGKTTTLYACLNEINAAERKIITIEDPVEYEMDGITQVQVNPKVDFTFSVGLRSLLRHDPDIIMIGEVRDFETVEIAIRTALTGHLVFSTLHTNDAASGVTRLIDMGVEPYLVASSVEAFVAQRLVRLICPKCKVEDTQAPQQIRTKICRELNLNSSAEFKIYKGAGCEHCNQTGYYGRKAIYEILKITDTLRSAILTKPRAEFIKKTALADGFKTLRHNGWQAVYEGFTTPDEIMNLTAQDPDQVSGMVVDPVKDAFEKKLDESALIQASNQNSETAYSGSANKSHDPVSIKYDFNKDHVIQMKVVKPTLIEADDSELDYEIVEAYDVTAGGVSFMSTSFHEDQSLIDVELRMSDILDGDIQAVLKICRVESPDPQGRYHYVSYFHSVAAIDKTRLEKYLKIKSASMPS